MQGSSEPRAYALFVIGALASTGVLPADKVRWNTSAALEAARRASAGSLEARLAVADYLLTAERDCEAALPLLRAASDEVLRDAEAEVEHSVPDEPVRLRDRLRDGAWESLRRRDKEQQLMDDELAARSVAEAQRHVGFRRLVGGRDDEAMQAAADAFARAAAAGDEYAAFNLGFMHMRGLLPGSAANHTAARALFEKAAARDLGAAFNGLGVLAFNGLGREQNMTEAYSMFERGAQLGDADAHYNLGLCHASGQGTIVDAQAALACFEAASDAGHWRAPHTLASLHAEGTGTPKNCTRAVRLALLFIEERLGWAEAIDAGIEQYDSGDALGALVQFALLSAQGSAAAASNAAFVLRMGGSVRTPWFIREEALQRADALLTAAAARGGLDAHVDLGDVALSRGDADAAARHYAAAAAEGVAEGMFDLALLHLRGAGGLPRNLTQAATLLRGAWDAAPFEEAVVPPALVLGALHIATAAERVAAFVDWNGAAIALAAIALHKVVLTLRRRAGHHDDVAGA